VAAWYDDAGFTRTAPGMSNGPFQRPAVSQGWRTPSQSPLRRPAEGPARRGIHRRPIGMRLLFLQALPMLIHQLRHRVGRPRPQHELPV
jgi:hypothetical protein